MAEASAGAQAAASGSSTAAAALVAAAAAERRKYELKAPRIVRWIEEEIVKLQGVEAIRFDISTAAAVAKHSPRLRGFPALVEPFAEEFTRVFFIPLVQKWQQIRASKAAAADGGSGGGRREGAGGGGGSSGGAAGGGGGGGGSGGEF
jgi:hypothetical protein